MALVTCLECGIVRFRAAGALDFARSGGSFRPGKGFPAFPEHESRNAEIDDDGDDTDNEVDVAGALKHFNQLRSHFRSADGAERHD